jgi:hypothetical protein
VGDMSATAGSYAGANFYVSSGGNVGIGKITPSAKLDVNGNAIITGSLTVTGGVTASLQGNASSATNASNASAADSVNGYGVAGRDGINEGIASTNAYNYVVRASDLEQSKYTTINIFNFINFI